ncbi:MAG: hypothetical protein HRT68_08195 [Flavobacteriaceae bacterium]|nr:hypothetical protein [Flavobacteriaceae bacterium]
MTKNSIHKIINIILEMAVAAALLGICFKVMNWPYAKPILIVASLTFALLYPIKFLITKERKTSDYLKLILAVFWGVGTLFATLELKYSSLLNYITLGVFLLWFLFKGIDRDKGVSGILFIISVILVGLGCIFRIMHWPGVAILFGLGILTGCLWVVIGLFKKPEEKKRDEIDEIGKS